MKKKITVEIDTENRSHTAENLVLLAFYLTQPRDFLIDEIQNYFKVRRSRAYALLARMKQIYNI
jgi:hypothetical protein